MPLIFNAAPGPRVFHVRTADGSPGTVTLPPGGSADLDLLVPVEADPVLGAWVEAETVLVGDDAAKRLKKLGRPVPGEAEAAAKAAEGDGAPKGGAKDATPKGDGEPKEGAEAKDGGGTKAAAKAKG